jgi:hypothetical protein
MNNQRILLTALAALALAGCPTNPPAETDAGRDAASTPDTGGGGDTGTTPDTGTSPDTGVVVTNDCAGYCGATLAACTGDLAQYSSMAECMAICTDAAWPAGTPGATSGNTIACRIYHAGVAASMPMVHCAHTGATGGGVCVGATPIFRADTTGYTRVDRMGMPAVATALIPSGSKDAYNDAGPTEDISLTFAGDILGSLTGLHMALDDDLTTLGLVPCSVAPADYVDLDGPGPLPAVPECAAQQYAPGAPVVSLLLPDALTITPTAPSGFPNGRRLADPVIDVTLAVIFLDLSAPGQSAATLAGVPVNPPMNDSAFLTEFPYLAAPHPAP